MTAIMDDDMSDISPQLSRAELVPLLPEMKWTQQYAAVTSSKLPGDKISLPPSALEQLLAAAPRTTVSSVSRPVTSAFDPYNPYTYAAERVARAAYEEHQPQLPHPLTFRLANPQNGRVIYAGIREFSAEEGQAVLSPFVCKALGLDTLDEYVPHTSESAGAPDTIQSEPPKERPRITVQVKQVPKGTFVKLRPLEAGYDPEDWKALLEQHLRANFTTLTNQEVLVVPQGRESYRFLVDGFKPEGDAICIVDTDIEVDIEALNEEQARETVKRIADKARRAPGTEHGSSTGGALSIFGKSTPAQVLKGDYMDYEITSWPKGSGIAIELSTDSGADELDLYVSPLGARHRTRPREDNYVLSDTSGRSPKRIRLSPSNVELEDAEAIYVSVHAYQSPNAPSDSESLPMPFTLRASMDDGTDVSGAAGSTASPSSDPAPNNPGDVRCKNCLQWVPAPSLVLHENFCLRNNILCSKGCGRVFQKRSEEFQRHWHCDRCKDAAHTYGDTEASKTKHDELVHTSVQCPESSCGMIFDNTHALAQHRSTECAGKLILCQFCHLQVPQGTPSDPSQAAECLLSNLTPHELADGARTTECHLCNKIVRLRDMRTHLLHHEMEKTSRPTPRVCRNVNCGRTLDGANSTGDTRAGTRMGNGPGNDIGLCSTCFGPLYVSMYDPDGKALKRRVERRYLTQLSQGCGKAWCSNRFCKTGRTHLDVSPAAVTMKEGLPLVKPFLEGLLTRVAEGDESLLSPLHFCVDESSQKRRGVAEILAAEGVYTFPWCLAALEAEGGKLDRARTWLEGWAPRR